MSVDNQIFSVGEVLKQVIEQNKLTYGIDKVRILNVWKQVAGEGIIRYTEEVKLHGDVLIIVLKSSALREELSYRKSHLIQIINEKIGKELIKEILFK